MISAFLRLIFILLLMSLSVSSTLFATPSSIGTSSSPNSLNSSNTQNKSFQDPVTKWSWQFYYDGTQIVGKTSADSQTWRDAVILPYNTADFSLFQKTISGTSYVFLVTLSNNYDIVLRRGTLGLNSISFDSEQLVLDGSSETDRYFKPTIVLDSSDAVFVSAIHEFSFSQSENIAVKVVRSSNSGENTNLTWNQDEVLGKVYGSIRSFSLLVSDGGEVSSFLHSDSGNLFFYQYDGSSWQSAGDTGMEAIEGFGGSPITTSIYAFAVYQGELYVGGGATDIGGIPTRDRLVKWVDGTFLSVIDNLSSTVFALRVHDNKLFVGGAFTDAGGDPNADRIFSWDGENVEALGSGLDNVVNEIFSFKWRSLYRWKF